MLKKLQYPESPAFEDLNEGNDRPNVSIVVRTIQNPMNTFTDLNFLVPDGITDPQQLKKTFLFADNIPNGVVIEDRLYERMPLEWRDLGLVRPYSSAYPLDYCTNLIADFKAGIFRILICTDTAGMVSSACPLHLTRTKYYLIRDAIFLMSISSFSGNFQQLFQPLYRGQEEPHEHLGGQGSLFCLLKNQHMRLICQNYNRL